LQLLEILDSNPQGLNLTQLSDAIESPKNSTSRLVQTLIDHEYVVRDDNTLIIRLTGKLLRMGQPRLREVSLVECSIDSMRGLRDAVGEAVQIGIPSGDEGIVIEQVMSTRAVRIGVDLGLRFGLHNNAPGKVLLALRPAKERERTIARIKLERCTDRTITDKQKLREECDRVVEQGYSTDWGEADEGIHCVAAPVRDRSNGLVAAHKNTSFGQARAFSGTSLPSMHPGNRIFSAWRKALLLGLVALSGPDVVRAADYLKEVKPLLQARCYSCHGALKQKAGLRLDTAVAIRKGGEGGSAIKAGNPSASPLLERVVAIDTEERMPPKHEGEPLTPAEVGLLKAWLADGAPAPEDELIDFAFAPFPQLARAVSSRGALKSPL